MITEADDLLSGTEFYFISHCYNKCMNKYQLLMYTICVINKFRSKPYHWHMVSITVITH